MTPRASVKLPVIRATHALVVLLLRHWVRAALPNRLRRDRGRRASAGLFRLMYLVVMSGWGFAVGHLVHNLDVEEQRVRGAAWIITGTTGLGIVWSALARGPSLRGDTSPLETSFLDALPVREGSKLIVGLFERVFIFAMSTAALIATFEASRGRAALAALVLGASAVMAGEAAIRVARVLLPAMMIARARMFVLLVGQTAFLLSVVQAPALALSRRLGVLVAGPPSTIVRAIDAGGVAYSLVIAAALGMIAVGTVAIYAAEHVGYDKVDLVPTARPKRTRSDDLVVERIDDVLRRREPGGRWSGGVMTVYIALIVAAFVAFSWSRWSGGGLPKSTPDAEVRSLIHGVLGVACFLGFTLATQRATRMATRDVAARPLLAPLPIEPRALLAGKNTRLRRATLVMVAPIVTMLATPWSVGLHVEMAWRLGAVMIAIVFATDAASSIAFLTVGAGARRAPGQSFVVESILVLLPLVGVATAPYAIAVCVPLAALGLVAREARRSALACVRWMDDEDDFARETPIWRALLVLGAFQSAQMLTGRVVGLSELDDGAKLAITYALSSVVLVGLTLHARRDRPSIRALPRHGGWMLVGLAGGALSGVGALGYVRLLRYADVEIPTVAASRAAILIMSVGLAPFAEEIFFRGWLLPCIEDELGARRAGLAPIVSAFAFAAVHPPLSFAPVFVLGLVTSALYARTRSIGPGVVAHLVHNLGAVLLAS